MAGHSANYRGILAMIGACGCFSANDALTKLAAIDLPVSEIVAIRGFFTLLFASLIIAVRGETDRLPRIRNPWVVLRALIEGFTGVLIIYALSLMPIADLTAILLAQPFLMTLVGVTLLGEQVGWRRWAAVVAGFVGVLLVIKPATPAFDSVSLVALIATVFVLARDLLTRRIPAAVPTTIITFATALASVPIGVAGLLAEPWKVPPLVPFLVVVASAVFLVFAFILMVIAFRGTDVSSVSPFRYSLVVFAVIFGIFLFGEIPDAVSFAGMGMIVAAGIYMLHRETMRRRERSGPPVVAVEPPH
ncbi:MAG TPA: DMT family transporter [Xanthobacteraceae bacterium]|jgi:drug/metabolite transporter (DMT)-like permease